MPGVGRGGGMVAMTKVLGWDKRWFVLTQPEEGGDATVRYYDAPPANLGTAVPKGAVVLNHGAKIEIDARDVDNDAQGVDVPVAVVVFAVAILVGSGVLCGISVVTVGSGIDRTRHICIAVTITIRVFFTAWKTGCRFNVSFLGRSTGVSVLVGVVTVKKVVRLVRSITKQVR